MNHIYIYVSLTVHYSLRFASGRPTAVVLDCGASSTSCVPVVDGYVLKKGLRFTYYHIYYLKNVHIIYFYFE